MFIGIGWDAPGITDPDKLRFDAALAVDGPFRPAGPIGHQLLPAGRYATATHVGPYSTLTAAHRRLFETVGRLKGVLPAGLPVVEMYHETTIDVASRLNHTDIYHPVVPSTAGRPERHYLG